MKTELKLVDHGLLPGQKVIELWFAGQFIGTVSGADGPGVRIFTKYKMDFECPPNQGYPTIAHIHFSP